MSLTSFGRIDYNSYLYWHNYHSMEFIKRRQCLLLGSCLLLLFWGCKKDPIQIADPVTTTTTTTPVPVPSPPLAEAFGLAVPHLTHARDVDIAARYDAGVRWVRRDLSWTKVEAVPGTFDFTSTDAVVDAELAMGIEVLAILDYGHPDYASGSGGDSHYPPDDLADYGRYVRETVTHFKDRIDVWEIWNEPNFVNFWKPAPDPVGYGDLVLVAINEIQQADPSASIMLGGMLGNIDAGSYGGKPWGYLEAVLSAHPGLLANIDILSIHPYTWLQYVEPEIVSGVANTFQIGFSEMILNCRDIATQAGYSDMPIWITELGWHTATQAIITLGVSEEKQAALWVRSCVMAFSHGVEKVFPYSYSDGSGDLTDKESHFGMMRYLANASSSSLPHEPKPAYNAYQTMTGLLSRCGFDKDLRSDLGLLSTEFAYRFSVTNSDDVVIVAWSTGLLPGSIDLGSVPQSVVSTTGSNLPASSSVVVLGSNPVFIVM